MRASALLPIQNLSNLLERFETSVSPRFPYCGVWVPERRPARVVGFHCRVPGSTPGVFAGKPLP